MGVMAGERANRERPKLTVIDAGRIPIFQDFFRDISANLLTRHHFLCLAMPVKR